MIGAIVDELAPNLVARNSIGQTGAAQLLLTAGDNPERLRSEVSFAALCGVSHVPASSGKTVRHRLNPGGDRAANSPAHYRHRSPAHRPKDQPLKNPLDERGGPHHITFVMQLMGCKET
jgi:transposase